MEYYSVRKGNKVLIDAAMIMNHKKAVLSEKSQTEKDKYYMTSFVRII